jgi:hypothetical protein
MWGVVLPYSIKGEQKCMLLPLLGGTALLPVECVCLVGDLRMHDDPLRAAADCSG